VPTRQTLDDSYSKLREKKRVAFSEIFEYGKTAQPEGFSIDQSLAELRTRFVKFNEWLVRNMDSSNEFCDAVWDKCSDGIEGMLFWFDSFVYALNPKLPDPHVKWVTYPIQEEYLRFRWERVQATENGLLEKSRYMGATWLACMFDTWFWTFTENGNCLFGSYVEALVDGTDADAIMPKVKYALIRMPVALKPPGWVAEAPHCKFLHIINNATGSVMKGEATKPNFGRGGRKFIVDMDEFAHWGHDLEAKTSVGMNANIIFFTSTPKGATNEFAKMALGNTVKKFTMKWTDNPEWQEGRYICEAGCPVHMGGGKPHSKVYDTICQNVYHNDTQAISQELDIDYISSGGAVFNTDVIQKVIENLRQNPPDITYWKLEWVVPEDIDTSKMNDPWELYRQKSKWRVKIIEVENGPLRVLAKPFSCRDEKCLCKGTGMHTYVLGGDVSKGVPGGDYDCLCMMDITAGRMVAEFHGRCGALELGEIAAKMCKWFGIEGGGYSNAWAGVESNAGGSITNDVMDCLGILLHVSVSEDKIRKKTNNTLGILVGNNKNMLIEKYLSPAISSLNIGLPIFDEFVEFWEEAATFISIASKSKDMRPDRVKMGAAYGSRDDRVMAREHCLHTAVFNHGSYYGVCKEQDVENALNWKLYRKNVA